MCNSDDLASRISQAVSSVLADGGGTPSRAEVTRLREWPAPPGDTVLERPRIYTGDDGCLYITWGKSGFKVCLVQTE